MDRNGLGAQWEVNLRNSGNMTTIIGGLFTNNTINAAANVTVDYAPYIEVPTGNPLIVPDFKLGKVDNIIGPQLTALNINGGKAVTYEDSLFRA